MGYRGPHWAPWDPGEAPALQGVAKESRGFSFLPGQTREGGKGRSWKRWETSPRFCGLYLPVLSSCSNPFPSFWLRGAPSFLPSFPGGKDTSSLLISYQRASFGDNIWYFLAGLPGFPPLCSQDRSGGQRLLEVAYLPVCVTSWEKPGLLILHSTCGLCDPGQVTHPL